MIIRLANKNDIHEIASVHIKSWFETYTGVIPQSILDQQSLEKRCLMWKDIFADSCQRVYVVEDQGVICGFMNVRLTPESTCSELKKLYILNRAQGQGFGRQFIEKALQFSRNHHYQYMRCRVLSANTSRIFYEKTGACFIRKTPATDFGEGMDDLDYQWVL